MSKPVASKQRVASKVSKTVKTGSAPKTKAGTTTTTKKQPTKPTQSIVRLFEVDPNSGPIDTPHKVFLYGKNIDPSRVKAKFGAAPSVFLTEIPTVILFFLLNFILTEPLFHKN